MSDTSTDSAHTPKVFEYALALYQALEKAGKDGTFEGSKTAVFRSLSISQGYYSRLFNALQETGCIEQVRRGSGEGHVRHSIIKLHHPPTEDEFTTAYKTRLTRPTEIDKLRQEFETLQGRFPDIDLNRYILSFEQRLTDLETRLTEIEGVVEYNRREVT